MEIRKKVEITIYVDGKYCDGKNCFYGENGEGQCILLGGDFEYDAMRDSKRMRTPECIKAFD